VQLIGGELWISYADAMCIGIYDPATCKEKRVVQLPGTVASFGVHGDYIFFADHDDLLDPEALFAAYRQQLAVSNETLPSQPMANVEAVLRAVKARGGENYIFTHRASATTHAYLEQFDLLKYFADIVTPQSPCFAWKPAPDGILYLLEKHGLSPEETAMVGDRQIDLDSGIAAGVKTVHYRCKAVPQELKCNWHFDDFLVMAQSLTE
jgi:HAD superfamily hydrolase (TIGR01509 family)